MLGPATDAEDGGMTRGFGGFDEWRKHVLEDKHKVDRDSRWHREAEEARMMEAVVSSCFVRGVG